MKYNNQHFICKVEDTLNPRDTPIVERYFNGTQSQAIKFFRRSSDIKKYLNNDRYDVYMRANPINLKEVY